ncbi:MAG TPA: ABC transporter transmembrane domain-containing protein [Chloroflexota bacterium]|nr:ABC transporter transmembrane domain-containing protein [Chloroflexota bacterium]
MAATIAEPRPVQAPPRDATGKRGIGAVSLGLLRRFGPYTKQCVVIVLAILVGVAFNAFFPLSIRSLIDDAAAKHDGQLFVRLVVAICCFYVVYAAAGIWRDRSTANVCARLMNDLRRAMFAHLQRLSMDYFAGRQVGDLVSHFSNDLAALEHPLRLSLPWTIHASVQILVCLVILFLLNWKLALVAILVLPLATIGPRLLSARAGAASDERRKQEAALSGTATEAIGGQTVIRVFGLQASFLDRFNAMLDELLGSSFSSNFLALMVGRSTTLSVIFGQVVVVIAGTFLVFRNELEVGALVGFVGVLLNIGTSFGDLSNAVPDWLQASGSMRRIENLLNEQPHLIEAADAAAAPRFAEAMEFRDVSFGYGPDRTILESVSLTIPAGKFVAFVGPSGSGKSTILNLILRLYEPSSGEITLDGRSLRQVTERSLREQMSVVLQESFLFDTSIRENIRMGRSEASDEDVEAAARAAQLHDLIQSAPLGYDTPVGERGGQLSGGQRQRIALARAILHDPAILVLDEATSALDPGTEALFNQTLAQFARGRTVISVTHRLAGVVAADVIFVMANGRVVEQGNHQQLVSGNGVYAHLWQKQAGFALSDDGLQAKIGVERLSEVTLFAGVEAALLEPVASLFFTERFEAGATIFREGDVGDKFYILVRGTAQATKLGANMEPFEVEVLQDGDFFGDIDLLQGGRRATTLTARTDCVALVLTGEHFRHLVEAVPVLRAIFEQVADVRYQQALMREAATEGDAGWSDTV